MPLCCVVNAIILYTLIHWIISNTAHAQTVDYLRVGRAMFCHAILITRIPTGPRSRSPRNTQSSFLSAPQIAQNKKNFQNIQTIAVEILEPWATSWCNEYQTTWFQFMPDKNQWILKRLQKQVEIVEIKLNKCIAKKKHFFSVFPCFYHLGAYGRRLLSGHSVWHIIVAVLDPDKSYSYG